MNEAKKMLKEHQSSVTGSEFSMMDIVLLLARKKKSILGFSLLVAVLAALISLALPNIYMANAKLLPPQQPQSAAGAILSQLSGMAGAVGAGASLKSPNELYIGMLKSRTIADALIKEFSLRKHYGTDSQEKARSRLREATAINAGKDGLITIEVEDEDQQFVARLANGYVNELIELSRVLAVTGAAQRRLFFERQLEISKNNLANSEMLLKDRLDTRGVISVDAESRALVESVSRLRAQISAKEIELGAMNKFYTGSNPELLRANAELSSLRSELRRFENGRATGEREPGDGGHKRDGLESIKVLRDVKYHQMLYELLARQYEAARLDEAKDHSIIQVLDPAVTPERKYKPTRSLIVVLSGFIAFILAIAWAILSEANREALRKSPHSAARWAELKSHIGLR